MSHPVYSLIPFNYHQWKEDMVVMLHTNQLFRLIEEIDVVPALDNDKEKYLNRIDEALDTFSP